MGELFRLDLDVDTSAETRRPSGRKASGGASQKDTGKALVSLDPTRTGRDASALEEDLKHLIVGQDEAIGQIVNIYQMHQTGMNAPNRPVGNFLFLGPTGSGKTRTVEALAEALVGTSRAVVKVDCAEFQHSHEIAKLIGSPPGYLGHRETHPLLSQETLNQYHTDRVKVSFVLFDEIEKASDALWNLLLGILDKATLTLGDNRKVDFSRAMIFLTSNLGASEMASIVAPKLGFGSALARSAAGRGVESDAAMDAKISRSGIEAARKKFTPEFMNRLDKVVVYKPLGEKELRQILDIELSQVQQRIFAGVPDKAFVFSATEDAKNYLLDQGIDIRYGARHLKRAIERLVVQPISNLLATEQLRGGDLIRIDLAASGDILSFAREAEGLPVQAMAEMVDIPVRNWMRTFGAVATEPVRTPAARTGRRA